MKNWHYYRDSLRVYSPDFDILFSYFNQVYPIIDASDNTERDRFDVCFDNWIKQNDWMKVIATIESDFEDFSLQEQQFLRRFLESIKIAFQQIMVMVLEGNH